MDKYKWGRHKLHKDNRINAPFLSWQSYLIDFAFIGWIVAIQSLIMSTLRGYWSTLIGVQILFALCVCLILALVAAGIKRYIYGRPVRILAEAAQKVAKGDFTVRVNPIRKDGRKDEIEVLIEDFNKMVEELQSVELLKEDFIANVSHEMKTPLSVIMSYSKALKNPSLSDETRVEYADVLMDTSLRMNAMIMNILKLNQLENQQIRTKTMLFQLGEQVRICALGYLEAWEEKEIHFHMEVMDCEVDSDPELLSIVWNNLLSNAVKFTPNGGTIKVTSSTNPNGVLVSVFNSGEGIKEEQWSHIFDKFYQCDSSHSTNGNGLGLAMVKRILEILGGEISLTNEGEGVTFHVSIPNDHSNSSKYEKN